MCIKNISCDVVPAWCRIRSFDDLEPEREDAYGASLAVRQVRAGRLRTTASRVTLGPLNFESHRYSLPVLVRRHTGRDVVTFAILGDAAVLGSIAAPPASVVVIPADLEFDAISKAAFRYVVVELRREELVEFSQSIGLRFDVELLARFARLQSPPVFDQRLARLGELIGRQCRAVRDNLG